MYLFLFLGHNVGFLSDKQKEKYTVSEVVIVNKSITVVCLQEISKLRYELCPRIMKERKFWRIYFILVNSHVAP